MTNVLEIVLLKTLTIVIKIYPALSLDRQQCV